MKDNLEIYNKYKAVPETALKAFDNGKFKGTDINTMWRIKCLTEAFGMVGVGWYYNIKRLWIETTTTDEQFAFAEIELFVKVDGEWSKPISGNGGNKLAVQKRDGDYTTSDEAYKMAVTDALGSACKLLGFGADVYWANDRTKYTNSTPQNSQQKVEQPKTTKSTAERESLTLEKALQLKTTKGKLYGELTDDNLKYIIDNSKNDLSVEAATLILEDRQMCEDLQPIPVGEEGLPF